MSLVNKQPVYGPGFYNTNSTQDSSSLTIKKKITAAQIATLHSVPVSIVAAPAVGFALVFDWMIFNFIYGTVAFTGSSTVGIVYHGGTFDQSVVGSVAGSVIAGTANLSKYIVPVPAAGGLNINLAQAGFDLYAFSADFGGGGDSTAVVYLGYRTIKLS